MRPGASTGYRNAPDAANDSLGMGPAAGPAAGGKCRRMRRGGLPVGDGLLVGGGLALGDGLLVGPGLVVGLGSAVGRGRGARRAAPIERAWRRWPALGTGWATVPPGPGLTAAVGARATVTTTLVPLCTSPSGRTDSTRPGGSRSDDRHRTRTASPR